MIIYQIADQLLATSHMPGNSTQIAIAKLLGNHTIPDQ